MILTTKRSSTTINLLPKKSAIAVMLAFATGAAFAQDAKSEKDGTVTLNEVTVVGSADKSGDNFKSAAQSVSIITEQDIKNIGANKKLDDLLGYEAGVLSKQFGADNKANWFKVRGFDANTTLDGTSLSNNGFFVWEQEIYGLEKVEVLKGANSFNYGATDAGGTINLVSKRPMRDVAGELNVSVGNFDRRTISGDYNGVISDSVSYRLVGLYSKMDYPIDHTGMEQFYFAPSLTWDITDRTSLTVLASILKKKGTPTNGFMPGYGSLIRTQYGKIGYDTNLGEPGRDYFDRKQYSLGYEFSHDFGREFKFTQNYRFGKMDHDFLGIYAFGSNNDRLANRGYSYLNGQSKVHSIDNRLSKTFEFGDIKNTVLFGLDYKRSKADAQNNCCGGVPQIDLFEPVYGAPFIVTGSPYELSLKQQGTYIFNKFDWNDTVLFNLGLRNDNYDSRSFIGTAANTANGSKNTHNASIMLRTDLGVSPYISHSTSFNPLLGADAAGRGYKPFEGEQLEVGVKYEPTWMRASFNLALFDLTEKNALISNASNVQMQAGERRNKGIELQSDLRISDSVSARLSYTRNNADQDLSTTRTIRAPLIPDNQAAIRVNYKHIQSEILNGLKLSLGVRYNGSTEDQSNYPGLKVASYTLVDAMASYPVSQHWSLQVNATNLFNKEYLSACDFYCYYGTSRTVDAQLSYLW
ncbi:MAG: TonB-dependent siderophore receptor [Methylophilus sp.]|uniref:TonB-dependent siderophore receptor n=1 Tax=Methylophilus sp. TaxID=29541 RepID=UPI003FA02526